jgi:hypothetical protein
VVAVTRGWPVGWQDSDVSGYVLCPQPLACGPHWAAHAPGRSLSSDAWVAKQVATILCLVPLSSPPLGNCRASDRDRTPVVR